MQRGPDEVDRHGGGQRVNGFDLRNNGAKEHDARRDGIRPHQRVKAARSRNGEPSYRATSTVVATKSSSVRRTALSCVADGRRLTTAASISARKGDERDVNAVSGERGRGRAAGQEARNSGAQHPNG